MAIRIAVGDESFEDIRKSGLYYVDKTELIYELVGQTDNKVTLFTRPRRFGKTLNLSMMESFFDINRDSSDVFEGLDIVKYEAFCREWMNQYPVLFLSFKDVDGLDFEGAYVSLTSVFADLCKKYTFLLDSEKVDSDDKTIFRQLKSQTIQPAILKSALKTLMRMMQAVYGKPVILLIDEYDVPLSKASEKNTARNRYYEQMLDMIKGLLSVALKTNEYLKFAVITGCLRIAKESIFTGTNNFASYSVLDDRFSRYFGFTQEEVDRLLQAADLTERSDTFRAWYDGYMFGNTAVYCPWDVASYVSALLYDRKAKPKNYWKNTSSNDVIRDFVNHTDWGISDKFEVLMNGGIIAQVISDELTYDTLHESEQNLWSILLMTGYLTKADAAEASLGKPVSGILDPEQKDGSIYHDIPGDVWKDDSSRPEIPDSEREDDKVLLRIPNAEIAGIFEDTVVKLFADTLDTARQRELMNALWDENVEKAAGCLCDFLWDTISYHDYHEDYYHAFMAGLFVGLGYSVESNKESGLGRFDVLVKDRRNRRALLIEAKKSNSAGQMEKDCADALRQIVDRGYARNIESGYEKVICYGVSFFRKSAMIKTL